MEWTALDLEQAQNAALTWEAPVSKKAERNSKGKNTPRRWLGSMQEGKGRFGRDIAGCIHHIQNGWQHETPRGDKTST